MAGSKTRQRVGLPCFCFCFFVCDGQTEVWWLTPPSVGPFFRRNFISRDTGIQ